VPHPPLAAWHMTVVMGHTRDETDFALRNAFTLQHDLERQGFVGPAIVRQGAFDGCGGDMQGWRGTDGRPGGARHVPVYAIR
jgi:hypothetical protein